MIFDKSSTRTRVSFETGMTLLGGHAIFLSPRDTQLGRGELVEDSARVLSSMVDIIMIRTFSHALVERFAANSRVPIINGLMTNIIPVNYWQTCKPIMNIAAAFRANVTWVGDGNNMCHSYINAAAQFDFKLRIACPKDYEPDAKILAAGKNHAEIIHDPLIAARDSDLIVTDVWASMGQEEEQKARELAFKDYQVNATLMQQANPDALFMHCLPAHREEEVSTEVLEGPQSVIWDEAENRLHAKMHYWNCC